MGKRLLPEEVHDLLMRYRDKEEEILEHDRSHLSYIVRESRRSLNFTKYRKPSRRKRPYKVPKGFSTTGGLPTSTNAALALGQSTYLERQKFPTTFTGAVLGSPFGMQYQGSQQLSGGQGLKESGLDRTHHLADSTILRIMEWLHNNRHAWNSMHYNRIISWMSALTSSQQKGQELFGQFVGGSGQIPTVGTVEEISNTLSNNPWNVGIGGAKTNQDVVGPYFDASKTRGGFDTPMTSVIGQYTEYLAQSKGGPVPDEIIRSGLAQVHDPSGTPVTSMSVNWETPWQDEDEQLEQIYQNNLHRHNNNNLDYRGDVEMGGMEEEEEDDGRLRSMQSGDEEYDFEI